jgi:hypothetical protein
VSPASALYEGEVVHRRLAPVPHAFRYRLFLALLDLDELPDVLDPYPLWSARRPAPVWVRAADFLGADEARDLVADRLGRRPDGPVRLLAQPRFLGVGFNPVSFLFCHRRDEALDAIVAEVTNTPWRERHAYVLDARDGGRGEIDKQLHVSPFQGMGQRYRWWASAPGERLHVGFRTFEKGAPVFEAALSLERRELSRRVMTRVLWAYPPMTIATLARIYAQALRLRRKGAPWFRHPAPAP